MRRRSTSRRGNTTLEFTFVGIPLVFVMISIFEISRGMWVYHTLAYGIKQGARFAAVHGQNCSVSPNSCPATLKNIADVIVANGGGLIPTQLQLSFCAPMFGDLTPCRAGSAAYQTCSANSCDNVNAWPPNTHNRVGLDDVVIVGQYPFGSVLAFFWPGARPPAMGAGVPSLSLPAQARERIEF